MLTGRSLMMEESPEKLRVRVRHALAQAIESAIDGADPRDVPELAAQAALQWIDDQKVEARRALEWMHQFAARGMSAGTAEIAQQAQAEGRQPGPKDAP